MSRWAHKIDVTTEWKRAEHDEITPQELCSILAEKLTALNIQDYVLNDIIKAFRELAAAQNTTFDLFDDVLEDLYNWGDRNKRLWIAK